MTKTCGNCVMWIHEGSRKGSCLHDIECHRATCAAECQKTEETDTCEAFMSLPGDRE